MINAVQELTLSENNSGEFNCTICKKKYKTKGGLTRHLVKKHQQGGFVAETADQVDVSGILNLVKASKIDLHQNDCYSKASRKEIFQHQFCSTDSLKDELVN